MRTTSATPASLSFRAYYSLSYSDPGRSDDDERHINGRTAVSGYRVRTLHSTDMRFMDMRAKINHLGVPGFVRSGMQQAARTSASQQGSLDTGTAWAYCSPASRTLETLILTFTE